jgi:hypothetical protein
LLISGSSKSETSADAEIDNRFNGALTYYLLKTLSGPSGLTETLERTVARVRSALHQNGYSQHPQLEGLEELFQQPFLATLQKKAAASKVA